VGAYNGLFRYDGTRTVHVTGTPASPDPTGRINQFHDTLGGLLVAAENGLFHYDGMHTIHVPGDPTSPVYAFYDTPGGLLVAAENGLFQMVRQPLSTAKIVLENALQLREAATSQDVLTRWTMHHPCSAALGDKLNLHVIATSETDAKLATGFQPRDGAMSFEATVPVPEAGNWTFRVVSTAGEIQTNIGQPSEAIPFITSGSSAWFKVWWKDIVAISAALLVALNLAVVAAARYSSAAWRLATDQFWGNALILQSLLLRHWRVAQLWLLDLYVRERRNAAASKSLPFLPLPLGGPDGMIADSAAVLVRLGSARHLWVQGGTGMGKTAMFLHLRQTHFGGTESTAFAIFRRDGYVLVPIEARRFPDASFEEKGASPWVIACVLSVLSEGGLSFEDRGLLRAMLSKGTLAIAIDGLNEVARGQAVSAFAAEFPAAPLLVTSQEPGESPFEVWRLPSTIAEHVNGLLTLYLGEQRGEALARHLHDSGLMQHLLERLGVRKAFVEAGKRPSVRSVIVTPAMLRKARLEAEVGKTLSRPEIKEIRGGKKYLDNYVSEKAYSWPRLNNGELAWPVYWDRGKGIEKNWKEDHERFLRLVWERTGYRYYLGPLGEWHKVLVPGAPRNVMSEEDWRFYNSHYYSNVDFYSGMGIDIFEAPPDQESPPAIRRPGRANRTGRSVGSYVTGKVVTAYATSGHLPEDIFQ